jgi:hypothetical protein
VSGLNARQKERLGELFGDRVTFDHTERTLYGHDIAAIPSLVKPLVGDTTPDAVVQPRGESSSSRSCAGPTTSASR